MAPDTPRSHCRGATSATPRRAGHNSHQKPSHKAKPHARGAPVHHHLFFHQLRLFNFQSGTRDSTLTMAGAAPKYIRHGAVAPPHVPAHMKWGSKLLGATMWFYIFYRIKQDGPVMFGMKLPFENSH